MGGPYRDNLEYLQDELAWLDGVVRAAVVRERASRDGTGGDFVSEESVDRLTGDRAEEAPSVDLEALLDRSARQRAEIAARVRASGRAGVALALPRTARLFGLSPFETDILMVCLAPELDLKYERLYAYLHDDATRRAPSVELVLKLLCHTCEERLLARESLLVSSRLSRFLLVEVRPGEEGRPLLARTLRLDERLAHALVGGSTLDGRLASAAQLVVPPPGAREASAGRPLLTALEHYLATPQSRQWLGILHGPDEAGQREAAQEWCAAAGLPLLRVDLAVLAEGEVPFERAVRLALREAALQSAAVRFDHADALQGEAGHSSARGRALEACLLDLGWITFLTGSVPWDAPDTLKRHWLLVQEFALPDYRERMQLWQSGLDGQGADGLVLEELAAQFRFTRREIGNAIHAARSLARQRGDASACVSQSELRSACRAESNRGLMRFARRVATEYRWDDLVLPAEQKRQLQEIVEYGRHREAIYSDWGFARKHSLGKGTNVLFSGPSGTGKTMAAGIIAADLGLELYKIDLSTVVSKYIGETEKNLHRVFHEAETANAILFFDEADALFGRRSEVKDSHDRYANIEVNYLLQKMEEHEGTVFLATNMSKSMDEAFLRRLHFTVVFPFPDQEERLRIWRQVFPTEAPVGKDVRFEFLARRLKIAGGNIKNIAVGAAFLARTKGTAIGMPQLVHAARREFQKMGKVYVKADFGEYHELVT